MNDLFVIAAAVFLSVVSSLTGRPVSAQDQHSLTIADPLTVLRDPLDLLIVEPLDEMRLVAPRGGAASGQVIMDGAPEEVTVSDMTGPGGAVLDAGSLRVRYAVFESPYRTIPGGLEPWLPDAGSMMAYYDVLQDHAEPEAELTPIWLTAEVPAGQPPGRYRGEITVDGRSVPVVLDVARWEAPSPARWTTHLHLAKSPETLAERYGVDLWSEPHWELVRRQIEYAAALGDNMVNIPIYFANEYAYHPRVFFIEEDGGYSVDFSIIDRYLELYGEIAGEPRVLLLNIYGRSVGHTRMARERSTEGVRMVGVGKKDDSGQVVEIVVPRPGEPGSEDWLRPLLEGIRRRMADHGWDQGALMFETGERGYPPQRCIELLKELAPEARWLTISHLRGETMEQREDKLLIEGAEIGIVGHPYAVRGHQEGGWDIYPPRLTTFRVWMHHTNSLAQYRSFPSGSVVRYSGRHNDFLRSMSGMTHVPFDFWEDDNGRSLLGRHQRNWSGAFLRRNTFWLVAPGPDGPVATARYEMFREGFQEVEARVKLEMALAGGWIEGEPAERAADLLERRAAALWLDGEFRGGQWGKGGMSDYGVGDDWQDLALELFELAGEAAEAMGDLRYYERERPVRDVQFQFEQYY